MALLNVAYTLASRGRHVLILDMDLEAPGIYGFLNRTGEFAPAEIEKSADILDLLAAAVDPVRRGDDLAAIADQMPPLSRFIRSVADEKLAPLKPKLAEVGRIDVAGTNVEGNFQERLANLRLNELSTQQLVDVSDVLRAYLKRQRFPFRPVGLEDFEDPIDTPYDYVLIDSRTGYTEIGGLCIGPIADRLVVLTSLNTQSVEGTAQFLKDAGIELRARTESTTPWDADDTAGANALGPKPTILVASPVPSGEITSRRQRLLALKAKLGLEPFSIPYQPILALQETIFVRDFPEEAITGVYAELTTQIMAMVGDDLAALSRRIFELTQKPRRNVPIAATLALRAGSQSPETGVPLMRTVAGAERDDSDLPLLRLLSATLAKHDSDAASYHRWGDSLAAASVEKASERRLRLAKRAIEVLEFALSLAPMNVTIIQSLASTRELSASLESSR